MNQAILATPLRAHRGLAVALVGAGPGDPGLLTLRALELIKAADVVIHDRLVSSEILDLIPANAERIDVGKGRGFERSSQEEIHQLLIEHASLGRRVVRLKGGDPFVFGRGSEESDALRAAGFDSEVVPGISSALAAPAVAGVPVTERGRARSFAVVTAETRSQAGIAQLRAAAGADTLVVMMTASRLHEVARALVDLGRSANQPAVAIERATQPGQRIAAATLSTIAREVAWRGLAAPLTLVIGDVGDHAQRLRCGPLGGRRIVVTRPAASARSFGRRLWRLGADTVELPLIEIRHKPAASLELPDLSAFDWLVATSKHGAEGFFSLLDHHGLDARALGGVRIAAVGPITAAAFARRGVRTDLVPTNYRAAALVQAMGEQFRADGGASSRVLFACGSRARRETADGLVGLGGRVHELAVYDTLSCSPGRRRVESLAAGADAVVFHSPSAVESFVELGLAVPGALYVAIGPTTDEALAVASLKPRAVAVEHSDDGILDSLCAALGPLLAGERSENFPRQLVEVADARIA